ncbi:SCO family protein [Halochromatium salexigens]|uniref:SCO family protein n=1 Tax=Halochromatium salexigens TaxID=49447 RepID=A0AAJ0UGV4_HALSE|nr:SCO family protein [Halochromatium salexigens]MBK5931241.1 SCO family protein [Halochromatium salexigens]
MSKTIPIMTILLLSALLLWLLLAWNPVSTPSSRHEQLELAEQPAGGDFQLTSARGALKLSDLRGKVVLLYFGYASCPDICPTNLAIIALALRELTPTERERVQVVFVSVDPQRDTPERLAEYVDYFHPNIIGVTGTDQALAAVAKQYGAAYRRAEASDSAMGYMIDHSAHSYVIDESGSLVRVLDHATPAEKIVATLRRHLNEPESI